jgi:Zn-dependent M28 family amino/carboxypeptidase
MPRVVAFVSAVALLAGSWTATAGRQASPAAPLEVSAARIHADIAFLADDLLEGREAATRGYDVAARYGAAALEAAGCAPGADDGSYLQQVPLDVSRPTAASMRLTAADGTTTELPLPEQGLIIAGATQGTTHVSAPLVFVGFGVTAPAFDYDDYAGLDVKGNIVAFLFNAPPRLPSEPRAHYASFEQKLRNAADHGAVAVVTLFGPDDAQRFPWQEVQAALGRSIFRWVDTDGSLVPSEKRLQAVAYLSPEGAARLFAGSPLSLGEAVEAGRKSVAGGAPLAATLTIDTEASHTRVSSPNVVGVLKGSDPALAGTSVVLTAHLDHIGVRPDGDGDRINNGAYDNATGSAIVLEVARVLAAQPARPKRSIVIVLVTAEEKGLLGSDYFAHHPVTAAGRMIAAVNLDMPVFLTASSDIVAFGSENSSLGDVVRQAAASAGYTLSPDPMPEQNIFVRSDQYALVKKGVPAVYLMPGFTAKDPSVNGQEVFGRFLSAHYHKPSDDLSLPMDLNAAARFTRVNLAVVRAIADDRAEPTWNPGNFFGKTFAGAKQPARSEP